MTPISLILITAGIESEAAKCEKEEKLPIFSHISARSLKSELVFQGKCCSGRQVNCGFHLAAETENTRGSL